MFINTFRNALFWVTNCEARDAINKFHTSYHIFSLIIGRPVAKLAGWLTTENQTIMWLCFFCYIALHNSWACFGKKTCYLFSVFLNYLESRYVMENHLLALGRLHLFNIDFICDFLGSEYIGDNFIELFMLFQNCLNCMWQTEFGKPDP